MPEFDFDFNFDHWQTLASGDPKRYFDERQQVIANFITSQPEECQSALLEMQAQIDALRASSGSPIVASRQMAQLIEDHLQLLSSQLRQLQDQTQALHQSLLSNPGS